MSEIPPASSPKKEILTPRQESTAEEFADDPPEAEHHYGEAQLWLIARDPRCLFAYWEFRPEEHPDAIGAVGPAQFFLRIYREEKEQITIRIASGAGHAFIPGQPPASGYFAELGFFFGEIWCFLARSGETRTPPELSDTAPPVLFATIPAHVNLVKLRKTLADSALPGERLATTAARIQDDARQHGEWTPEHERLLAEILGESDIGTAEAPASPLTLTQRIQQKLQTAANAAAPCGPMLLPEAEDGLAPASSWPTSK